VVCVVTGRFALRIAPPSRKPIQRLPLEIKTNMGVVFQHLPGDVTSDGHDGRVTGLRLSQFGDGMMPEVVKA